MSALETPSQTVTCRNQLKSTDVGTGANDRICKALLQKQSSHIFLTVFLALLGSP